MEAIFLAAEKNQVDEIRTYLDQGGNVDAKYRGTTLLTMAAAYCAEDVVKLLVERGADVNLAPSQGTTAVMFATMHGYHNIAEYLLDHGAAIDAQDNKGLTTLMHLPYSHHMQLYQLFKYHPNLELQDNYCNIICD